MIWSENNTAAHSKRIHRTGIHRDLANGLKESSVTKVFRMAFDREPTSGLRNIPRLRRRDGQSSADAATVGRRKAKIE